MAWLKLLFLLLLALLTVASVRAFRDVLRFQRRFNDSSPEAAEHLRHQVEGMVSTDALGEVCQAAERELLRRLCTGEMSRTEREQVVTWLKDHTFHSVVHEQVFHALLKLPADRPDIIRDQLAASLTRQGFPDVDLQDFLAPTGPDSVSTEELFNRLRRQKARTVS